jgi:hypothetical protein
LVRGRSLLEHNVTVCHADVPRDDRARGLEQEEEALALAA